MFFPKDVCGKTEWVDNDSVELERKVGCEYLNAFSPLLMRVFKCNHDIKFLTAGEGPEKAYYMLKYATKPQNVLENPVAVYAHAFDKASRKREITDSAVNAGKRCVQSMCCTLSKPQEVSAPMAALYVLRESAFYASADFVKVALNAFVDMLFNEEPIEVMLRPSDNSTTYRPQSAVFDYVHRPQTLDRCNLMEFSKNWTKQKNLTGLRFLQEHGQYETHTIHRRLLPVVATIIGKRLPDARDNNMPAESRKMLQRSLLTLFKPFRRPADLALGGRDSAFMFQSWWDNEAPDSARQFLENSNDYYTSRELARKRSDESKERFRVSVGASDLHDIESDDDIIDEPFNMGERETEVVDRFESDCDNRQISRLSLV
ncbi:hypothetical protein PPTG_05760 [Phytophthora nicotianae INRA-310]|uniref:Uncharacterized protein n=1 Tax=Phytophthora nicotianae (strain INRA-310) TaxID=761204 RepID=W2QWD0_PHYN3|nr:hypothetical protein PPTG_05760 [Phytophthora nicotianae INRA-310]ETN16580.1 hypothetical protein PPTG_05760 [Phytophthora nicotianae INRA-310]